MDVDFKGLYNGHNWSNLEPDDPHSDPRVYDQDFGRETTIQIKGTSTHCNSGLSTKLFQWQNYTIYSKIWDPSEHSLKNPGPPKVEVHTSSTYGIYNGALRPVGYRNTMVTLAHRRQKK